VPLINSLCIAGRPAAWVAGPGIIDCNNNLAGDPDFGYVKSCNIEYKCASGAIRTLEAIEMEPTRLTCR